MKPECPYLRRKPAGSEVYDWCDLSDHPCQVDYGGECETYEDWLKEASMESLEEAVAHTLQLRKELEATLTLHNVPNICST